MPSIKLTQIVRIVSTVLKVSYDDILERKNRRSTRDIAIAKQVICYVTRKNTSITEQEIAATLCYKTHTSVIFSVNKAAEAMEVDNELHDAILTIELYMKFYSRNYHFANQNTVMSV